MSKQTTCGARIFPPWVNRWTRCGSPIGSDGRCVVYKHKTEASPLASSDAEIDTRDNMADRSILTDYGLEYDGDRCDNCRCDVPTPGLCFDCDTEAARHRRTTRRSESE